LQHYITAICVGAFGPCFQRRNLSSDCQNDYLAIHTFIKQQQGPAP